MPHLRFISSSNFIVVYADLKQTFGSSFEHKSIVQFIIHSILPLVIINMQNYQHAKRSDYAKARINRKRIMQQKRHGHAQSSSQPRVNCTSEYNSETSHITCSTRNQFTQLPYSHFLLFPLYFLVIVSDSSESVNSESTQGTAKRMFHALFCYGSNIAIICISNLYRFRL